MSPAGRITPKCPKIPAPRGGRSGCCPEPRPGPGVAAAPEGLTEGRGYTSARGHGQKVCQWDRMAPTAGPRAAAAPGAIAPPRPGPAAGPCHRGHLHKGRPVAAGRELGKKCLQWEESKYHRRDILIAGWRSLLLIFFNPFVVSFILIPILGPSAPGWSFRASSPRGGRGSPPPKCPPPFTVWPMLARWWWEEVPNSPVGKLRHGGGGRNIRDLGSTVMSSLIAVRFGGYKSCYGHPPHTHISPHPFGSAPGGCLGVAGKMVQPRLGVRGCGTRGHGWSRLGDSAGFTIGAAINRAGL